MNHNPGKPNIVLIMADDMGYGDVGAYNPASRIPTPHMDRLAAEGVRLTDAHAPSAVCTPTRYGVLTGRYCWRTHLKQGVIGGYARPLIEESRLTVASMLKQCGYHTACIGKWHVGLTFHDRHGQPTEVEDEVDFTRPISGGPRALGFDYAYINAGCGTCAPPYGFIENDRFVDDRFTFFDCDKDGPIGMGRFGQWGGMMGSSWVTKDADPIIADKACTYIEQRASEEAPFFMYLTPNAPHEPCLERFVPELARGKSQAGARGDLVWLFDWVVGAGDGDAGAHGPGGPHAGHGDQ
jgi:arylsulfatase A